MPYTSFLETLHTWVNLTEKYVSVTRYVPVNVIFRKFYIFSSLFGYSSVSHRFSVNLFKISYRTTFPPGLVSCICIFAHRYDYFTTCDDLYLKRSKDLVDPAGRRIVWTLHCNFSIIYENRRYICISIFYLFLYSNNKNPFRVKESTNRCRELQSNWMNS